MKKLVVDSSVAIKWFVPEVHSAAAARLLDPQIVICAPDLIASEFGNTLWKKIRRGEITRDEATEILSGFDRLALEFSSSIALLGAAFQLACALERSVYDSLYLSLAVAQECSLITADRKFHSIVSASPFAGHILWVEEEP
jgi:predicted nucleic acid-binding protein